MLAVDVHDIESALPEHAVERVTPLTEGYGFMDIVVADVDGGILALLIIIVGALVFIEGELAVLTTIYI